MNDDLNQIAERIKESIETLRRSLDEELSRLEKSLKDQSGDVHHRVSERQQLVRELEIDKKLTEIYEEVKYYPSWAARDDWGKYRTCEIDDPIEEEKGHEKIIQFGLNDKNYALSYNDEGSSTGFDGDYFHHTHLSLLDAQGNILIGINISVEVDYVVELIPFSVDAFKPGEWIKDVLECYELFQANKKRKEIEDKYEQGKIDELKNNFDLE